METKHLKKFAPEVRREFIAAVTNKAALYGLLPKEILPMQEEGDVVIIGDRPFPRSVAKQRKELEDRIRKEGFQQFIEAVAYTWFNRFSMPKQQRKARHAAYEASHVRPARLEALLLAHIRWKALPRCE